MYNYSSGLPSSRYDLFYCISFSHVLCSSVALVLSHLHRFTRSHHYNAIHHRFPLTILWPYFHTEFYPHCDQ